MVAEIGSCPTVLSTFPIHWLTWTGGTIDMSSNTPFLFFYFTAPVLRIERHRVKWLWHPKTKREMER